MSVNYKEAGVNIDAADEFLGRVKKDIKNTFIPGVLGDVGFFGSLFELDLGRYKKPVLVSSVDGVGTKLKVAFDSKKYNTVGQDLVNHCVNDIAVGGAIPLFFLDYYGTGKLEVDVASEVISGLAKACRENNCALIGGETAEMPGIYSENEFDLVGTIVGVVEKDEIVDGSRIQSGDALIGIASHGLHTNGYSLARKILFEISDFKLDDNFPETSETVSDVLLRTHKSYLSAIQLVKNEFDLKGASHITGGGFLDNIPRILPNHLDVEIQMGSWPIESLFRVLQKEGDVDQNEMYRVFNMGIGMIFVVPSQDQESILKGLGDLGYQAYSIGRVIEGQKEVRLLTT